jgi:hypothetical protein
MRNLVMMIAATLIVMGLTAAAEAQMDGATGQGGMRHSRMSGGMSGKQMMSHKRMKMNGMMTHNKMHGARMSSKNM